MDKFSDNLELIEKYTIYLVTFFLPFAFLPVFVNAYSTPKIAVLTFGVILLITIRAIRTIIAGKFQLNLGSFDLPVAILVIVYLASAILRSPSKMDAFFLPGTATLFICSGFFYFFANGLKVEEKKEILAVWLISVSIVSLGFLLSASQILKSIPGIPDLLKDPLFNLQGSVLDVAVLFASSLFIGIGVAAQEKKIAIKAAFLTGAGILLLGLAVSVYVMLPGKPNTPALLDFGTSWSVAVDSLKQSPLLGAGPANYTTAFSLFRPVSYNTTNFWQVRFNSARDFYLTVITETGILGALGLALMIYFVIKMVKSDSKLLNNTYLITLIVLLGIFTLFSATPTLIFFLFLMLSLSSKSSTISANLTAGAAEYSSARPFITSRVPAMMVIIPALAILPFAGFWGAKAMVADMQFKDSLDSLAKNDGLSTYNLMSLAIGKNPYIDRYHASFAQVNFALANSIAQKKELTDDDKNNISQLIQQAIAQGKATVAINPQKSANWEILASTYRSIMPFAQGADQFAIATYQQAIALDPINPELRITLGGIYYALKNYKDAIDVFKLAAAAKPDLANARYNLAIALREDGQYERAVSEMTAVLSLVDKDSKDYETAKTELEALEAKVPAKTTTQGENLTAPSPTAAPAIKPKLELPDEAQPPSPSPSPEGQGN